MPPAVPPRARIESIMNRGLRFLADQQATDGSWPSMVRAGRAQPQKRHTTFFTSLILCSLGTVRASDGAAQRRKAVAFLKKNMSAHSSFNYWARGSAESEQAPLPDDLDDTVCALSALTLAAPEVISPAVMANVVRLLTAGEVQPGGPYHTWIVSPALRKKWDDVDGAVNANIAFFLSLHDVHLPKLSAFLTAAIRTRVPRSPYYLSHLPILYFLARAGVVMPTHVLTKASSAKDILSTALAACTLLRTPGISQKEVTPYILNIFSAQLKSGGWSAASFGIERVVGKTRYLSESSALTTAVCIEACGLYMNSIATNVATDITKEIVHAVRTRYATLTPHFRQQAHALLDKTLARRDSTEIMLLPYWFTSALAKEIPARRRRQLAIVLGAANMYGWIAYTLYDDILDGDASPHLLPLASMNMRCVVEVYEDLTKGSARLRASIRDILDRIDSANAWEQSACLLKKDTSGRIIISDVVLSSKNYGALAEKSLGHALGPLLVLASAGSAVNSDSSRKLLEFFRHYLIARQMNDDAHDWADDLSDGRINSVSGELLLKVYRGAKKDVVLTDSILLDLKKQFWQSHVHTVSARIIKEVRRARHSLEGSALLSRFTFCEKMVAPLEQSALRADHVPREIADFTRAYKRLR